MKVTDKSAFRTLEAGHVNVNDVLADLELQGIALAKMVNNGSQSNRIECDCPECRIHGRAVPLHRQGDCAYAAARSELVLEAARLATEKVGEESPQWTSEFNRQMERLARPQLRS